ncbi:ABC transporter permease [Pelagibacterium montanilacus]|uniref:ABC transporter permease n=1 Tax=Pelagibacterium montanilacus TaxID=2185280 RepID=UPI000F8C93F0|nr:ABC transporter permease [Pelagibacterium montanilacus]
MKYPVIYRLGRFIPHMVLLALVLVFWEVAVARSWVNAFMVPRPTAVFDSFIRLYVTEQTIYRHFAITMTEAVFGFAIGASVGISLAVASAVNETFRRYVSPYAIVLNVTPGLALTPIIIAWFGFGIGSKIALAAVISFFPIFVNTLSGLTNSDPDRNELFRSLGANASQRFWKLQVPSALPITFAGLKIGMTTALIGAVVAEFAQATEGVGVLMQRFSFQLNMASSVAVLLTMSIMGVTLYYAMELLDDRLIFWRKDSGMARVGRRRSARVRALKAGSVVKA